MAKNKHNEELVAFDKSGEYITLKEASELSDYAPDYIGQLIRAGKIEGRQVYNNVAWVTTEAAIREYMQNKGKDLDDSGPTLTERLPEFLQYVMYGVIGLTGVLLISLVYILSVSIDHKVTDSFKDDLNLSEYGL